MITLEQALDTVSELPLEQQEMLLEIIWNRFIETRRQEIAQNAQEGITAFHQGELFPQSAEAVITELRAILQEN